MVREALSNIGVPTAKVTIGVGVGSLGVVVVWALNEYLNAGIPTEIGMSINTFLVFIVQYMTRDR